MSLQLVFLVKMQRCVALGTLPVFGFPASTCLYLQTGRTTPKFSFSSTPLPFGTDPSSTAIDSEQPGHATANLQRLPNPANPSDAEYSSIRELYGQLPTPATTERRPAHILDDAE